jgi:nucleotide-binding universal stress UspA family protein
MIKSILVPASGTSADHGTFAAALKTARQFDAHLDVLHVRLDPVEAAVAMSADSATGNTLMSGMIERMESDATNRAAQARKNFDGFCTREKVTLASAPGRGNKKGVTAEWHVETGQEPRWFVTYGRTTDLIVAPRATADDPSPRSLLEAVLLDSGRPVLIPSAKASPAGRAETVAIGWKPEPQCARAVAAAMPLISQAKNVVVLCVEENDNHDDEADRLIRNFAWHGISATIKRPKPGAAGAAATLLAAAAKAAGLLVMGGYGHTRLREWVFGGFTQRALADAPLPILIVH